MSDTSIGMMCASPPRKRKAGCGASQKSSFPSTPPPREAKTCGRETVRGAGDDRLDPLSRELSEFTGDAITAHGGKLMASHLCFLDSDRACRDAKLLAASFAHSWLKLPSWECSDSGLCQAWELYDSLCSELSQHMSPPKVAVDASPACCADACEDPGIMIASASPTMWTDEPLEVSSVYSALLPWVSRA